MKKMMKTAATLLTAVALSAAAMAGPSLAVSAHGYHGGNQTPAGWRHDGNHWYCYNQNGARRTGWIHDNGCWYYCQNNGVMQTGWIHDGGHWYYCKGNGAMATGWQQVNGQWYYLNSSGAMHTGWLEQGGCRYYLFQDGHMATGEWIIDGELCRFESSGALVETPAEELALEIVNAYRREAGVPELELSDTLQEAAAIRAEEIIQHFEHERPDGRVWITVLDEVDYTYNIAGENIAFGYSTPESVIEAWMGSPGHRANILSEDFKYMGCAKSKDRTFWAQLFGNRP